MPFYFFRYFANTSPRFTVLRGWAPAFGVSIFACAVLSYSPLCLSSNTSDAYGGADQHLGVAYSLGASMGAFIDKRAEANTSLGIKMLASELVDGFADGVAQSSKLPSTETQALLEDYDKAVQWLSSTTATGSAKHSLTAQQNLHLQAVGYALGVTKGEFLRQQLVSHRQLGFEFDGSELIAGFKDALNHDVALSQAAMADLLVEFNVWVKSREQERAAVNAEQRIASGELFIDKFRHKAGGLTTQGGVSYRRLSSAADNTAKPTMGDSVMVNYRGWLIDGNEFVSGSATQLELAKVIPGLSDGLQQMNIGSQFRLVIPASLGFGDVTTELVPSNSVLIFDVELLSIVSASS